MRNPQRTSRGSVPVALLTLALLTSAIATPRIHEHISRPRPSRAESAVSQRKGAISTSSSPHPVQRTSAAATYNKAPLSFEANHGQADASVKFLTRGAGYELYLTSTQAVMSLERKTTQRTNRKTDKDFRAHANLQPSAQRDVVRMTLIGARSGARVAGEEVLPGKVNYLLGSDPQAWRRDIATYGKVRYNNIYQGIDLVYHGNQRRLEYDFQVTPGADPDLIRLGFEGVKRIGLDSATGDLVMRLSGGALIRQHKPILYQEVQGARRPIAGQFVMRARGQIGFDVGVYDKTLPLIIDPVLVYGTYFGGDGQETTAGIAVDASGSVYVTGSFVTSFGFPVTANAFQKTQNSANGNGEVFITKFTPDGQGIVYSTLLGGNSTDVSTGLGLDAAGNAYVVGWTDSADFPVRNAFQPTLRGFPNAFVTKLSATGSDLLYSTFFGGSSNFDFGTDIAVDPSGNAYITGDTASTDFPVTPGASRTTHVRLQSPTADKDGFIAKLNTNLSGASSLVYSTFCDVHDPFSNSIDIDPAGNAYVTGDARVQKLNSTGAAVLYSFTIPDAAANITTGLHTTDVAVDADGQAYVTGLTNSPGLQIVNGFQPAFGGGSFDGFLAKLNASGTSLLYSTYLGGQNLDEASAVEVDLAGHAYVVGYTASVDFPIRDAFQTIKLGGGTDIFVTKIDTNSSGANSLIFSTYYGASNYDEAAAGVALDPEGNIYVTGFPFTVAVQGIIHTGASGIGAPVPSDQSEFDPFILKISNTSSSNIHFGAERLFASESAGSFEVTVVRSGDTSAAANVEFGTLDGSASGRSDYTSAFGTLRFAAGETSKSFRVFITDDSNFEGDETFYVTLHANVPGVALAAPAVTELHIQDNDTSTPASNPIDNPPFFIRQQYLDFLGRDPDSQGFANWMATLTGCPNGGFGEFDNPDCDRVHVSASFVQSHEFQTRGYWILRFGYVGLNRSIGAIRSSVTYAEFIRALGQIGGSNSPEQEEAAKVAYTNAFVQRSNFLALFPPAMTAAQYVNALESNAQVTLSNKQALVDALNGGTMSRADVLRNVVESQAVFDKYISRAFVTMEYFGYLRRDPDLVGYQNWVNSLTADPANYRHMIFGFIYSTEYRQRFGPP